MVDRSIVQAVVSISRAQHLFGGSLAAAMGLLLAAAGYATLSAQSQTAALLMLWLATLGAFPGAPLLLVFVQRPSETLELLQVPGSEAGSLILLAIGALLWVSASVLTLLQLSRRS